MKKKANLRSALTASIDAEEKSVANRFDRAEELLGKKTASDDRFSQPVTVEEKPQEQKNIQKLSAKRKSKTEKVVRDSFTMPPRDYQRIAQIIDQGLKIGVSVNKSEVVRAGLIALQKMSPEKLHLLLQEVERVKPGRPSQ